MFLIPSGLTLFCSVVQSVPLQCLVCRPLNLQGKAYFPCSLHRKHPRCLGGLLQNRISQINSRLIFWFPPSRVSKFESWYFETQRIFPRNPTKSSQNHDPASLTLKTPDNLRIPAMLPCEIRFRTQQAAYTVQMTSIDRGVKRWIAILWRWMMYRCTLR